jgi:uncharacterized membrane protein
MHPIHPMAVHFPIALLSASVLFDLLSIRWRSDDLRAASFYTLILGLVGAVISVISGHLAEEGVEHSGVPKSALEIHETLGFVTFWVFAGLLLLRLAEWLNWIDERRGLRVALGIGSVVVLFVTSYYGGSLVYEYGVGVLTRPSASGLVK